MVTVPLWGTRPTIARYREDFPAPFGPTSATTSPGWIAKVTSWRAR